MNIPQTTNRLKCTTLCSIIGTISIFEAFFTLFKRQQSNRCRLNVDRKDTPKNHARGIVTLYAIDLT